MDGFSLHAGVATKAHERKKLERICRYIAKHRASMNWAQRLKRVFNIDVEICDQCGGAVRLLAWVIASIEDPVVIKKILDHLDRTATTEQERLAQSRAPPQDSLFN